MIFSFSFFFFGLDVPWNFLLTSSLLLLVFVCSMLLLAIKLHQHLSFQCSHLKSLCNIAISKVFTMKPCQHLSLYWSRTSTLFFIKLPQHFICIEATSTLHSYRSCANIHFSHEAMTTLHLHRSRANIHEATKSWQHSTLAQIFKGNIA